MIYLRPEARAQMLGISLRTLAGLVKAGKHPAPERIGRSARYALGADGKPVPTTVVQAK